jgi:hypothetical protein
MQTTGSANLHSFFNSLKKQVFGLAMILRRLGMDFMASMHRDLYRYQADPHLIIPYHYKRSLACVDAKQ